jgi:NhaP-type Na+/H+ or K+/H+ antiporter
VSAVQVAIDPILFLVAIFVVIGIFVARAAEHRKFPRTLPLILTGIALGVLNSLFTTPLFDLQGLGIPIEIVATLALSAVLFREGLVLDVDALKRNVKPVILLASLGTVLTTFLIGILGYFAFELTLIFALLFGAIFSPTDPAATFALFEGGGTKIKKKLVTTLGGESAFNDAVGIVIVTRIFLPAAQTNQFQLNVLLIVWTLMGGIIIGFACGWLGHLLIARVRRKMEISLITLSVGLLAFSLAELSGSSSAIAALLAGITLGSPHIVRKPPFPKEGTQELWGNISFLGEIVAFILIGAFFDPREAIAFIPLALVMTAIILISRPIAVLISTLGIDLTLGEKLFVGWTGMRGLATAALVAISFEELHPFNVDSATALVNASMLVLLFTSAIQGLTIPFIAAETNVVEEIDELEEITAQQIATAAVILRVHEALEKKEIGRLEYTRLATPFQDEYRILTERRKGLETEQRKRIQALKLELESYMHAIDRLYDALEACDIGDRSCEDLVIQYERRIKEVEAQLLRLIEPAERSSLKERLFASIRRALNRKKVLEETGKVEKVEDIEFVGELKDLGEIEEIDTEETDNQDQQNS